ncbi:MAG: serine/threonine protein phosphatase [Alphaproteobacteria bacterium]|nr:serine/threonine protein phosphatase [Alphaproteobacteria bacterium]
MKCAYYAIGDVHGEAERLRALHDAILNDIAAHGWAAEIVHLGDYVDRGPDSRGVIAAVMALQATAAHCVRALRGNHEQMMLDAYDRFDNADMHWMMNGGAFAAESYGWREARGGDWRACIDKDHVAWLRGLPTLHCDDARKIAFVHAGIDPKTFPACSEEIRIWTRSQKFFDPGRWPARPELDGWLVVHGHTPTNDFRPQIVGGDARQPRRINVDTGAVFGGALTCVVLAPDAAPRFLAA